MTTTPAAGQNASTTEANGLSVFLDLTRHIDDDFIRQEIALVTYVRDKEHADVHIIMSRHSSGNTGDTYNISFIGYGKYSDKNYQLNYWAPSSNTTYITRKGYAETIKRGLIPFLADSPLASLVDVTLSGNSEEMKTISTPRDPWNNWVFEIYGSTDIRSESTRNSLDARYGFFADRITEGSKIRLRPYGNYNKRNIETDDGTVSRKTTRNGVDSYYIKSIGENWGIGVFADLLSSSFDNYRARVEFKPALEYSFFPYREATRRSITISWRTGVGYSNYLDETVFDKNSEILFGQALAFSVDYRQPWGNLRANLMGFHHFHNIRSNRAEVSGSLNLRVVEGLGLNFSTSYSIINDQRNVSKANLSIEDILLEQQRRATSYQFRLDVGVTYTFGSKITGIYNPRLN
ncbi:MAG: hypothetical protein R6W67_03775 [Bacteroidales bacterium]